MESLIIQNYLLVSSFEALVRVVEALAHPLELLDSSAWPWRAAQIQQAAPRAALANISRLL